jgi:hypothetical protein
MKFKYSNTAQRIVILAQDMYPDEYGTIVKWEYQRSPDYWKDIAQDIREEDRPCQFKLDSKFTTHEPHIIYRSGSGWWGVLDDYSNRTNRLYVEVER